MDFRSVFCTVSTVEHLETVSKWNIDVQPQLRKKKMAKKSCWRKVTEEEERAICLYISRINCKIWPKSEFSINKISYKNTYIGEREQNPSVMN